MQTSLIHPATFKLDGGAMFGIIPKPLWEKKIKPDEFNRINMSLRVVLFQTKTKNILVDTGIGDYHNEKFKQQFDIKSDQSPLIEALKEKGLNADDITDIVLTHLHFDHVGGLGQGEHGTDIIFKNAKIHMHKRHYKYAQKATLRDAGSFHAQRFIPLLEYYIKNDLIHFLDEQEQGIILEDSGEKLYYKVSFGHTPYMIHPYNDQYIYMADLVPMSHHVHIPWVMGYDIEPATTTDYKQNFYNFIMQRDLTMIFEHDNSIWGGKLAINDKKKYVLIDQQGYNKERVINL